MKQSLNFKSERIRGKSEFRSILINIISDKYVTFLPNLIIFENKLPILERFGPKIDFLNRSHTHGSINQNQ